MGDAPRVNPPLTAVSPAADAQQGRDAIESRVRQMAEQFEAMILTQMLRQMRQTLLTDNDGEDGGLGKDTFTDSIDIELGSLLSRSGGFGLANELSKALARRIGTDTGADTPRGESLGAPSARAAESALPRPAPAPEDQTSSDGSLLTVAPGKPQADAPAMRVPQGRVSSAFGWRQDPFNGSQRFHNGIDLAQAYGQDVRVAAAGRVAFSGDRGSYGSTIIVEHAGGRRTLYAHLSRLDVREGDAVDEGQVIGKSGSSGRSTGPHLHFEVLESGRPVDPSAVS
jgi:murein DD-endopeptidase MepM/ murein hydrolase activator NlpD